jgi:hypothetical protein
MGWVRYVASMGEARIAYRILIGKSEEQRQFGRPRSRWKDNTKMYMKEIGCKCMDLPHGVQDQVQG